jgi:hypothetical protein
VDSTRKLAFATGVLFIITFVASIPAAFSLYKPVLHNANYIIGAGADSRVLWGAFSEVVLVIANIASALVLFPLLKRQNEGVALGYVCARVVESMIIVVGILSLLSIVTLRHAGVTGAEAASLVIAGKSLLAVHKWSFLLGPGLLGSGSTGMLLGYLMYRSGLVPRRLAILGLIGGPLVVASGIAVLFGAYEQTSTLSGIATIPEILWEGAVLGIYLIVKGFKPSPITSESVQPLAVEGVFSLR